MPFNTCLVLLKNNISLNAIPSMQSTAVITTGNYPYMHKGTQPAPDIVVHQLQLSYEYNHVKG
jgi:hypothetical protein